MATEFVLKSKQGFDPSRLPRVTVEVSDGTQYQAHGFEPSAVQLQLGYVEQVAQSDDSAAVLAELRNALLHTFDEADADDLILKARSAGNPVSIAELFRDLLPKLVEYYEPEFASYQQEMGIANGNREQRRAAKKSPGKPAAKKVAAGRPAADGR